MDCFKVPQPFETDQNETAYWMVTPKGYEDPTVLMSSLETKFVVSTDKEYPTPIDGTHFMCINCFEKFMEEL